MGEIRLRNVVVGGCGGRGARQRPASGAGDDKASLGESLDMGDEEDSSGARGTKLQVARGILAWRVQARSLRRRNAHRFPKIGAACASRAMGHVDVFGSRLSFKE